MGILHRDIKPENFLLTKVGAASTVKLADFGLSTFFTRGKLEKEAVGSPYYMAPEMVVRGSPGYGPEADIWSCGVCLYKFLSGRLPFPGETSAEVFNAIRHREVDYASMAWRGTSASARDLLCRILEKDPAKRITAEGILTSPWMTRFARGSGRDSRPASVEPEEGSSGNRAVTGDAATPSGSLPVAASIRNFAAVRGGALGVGTLRRASPPSGGPDAAGPRPATRPAPLLAALGTPAAASARPRNKVGDAVPSARVFFLPEDTRPRLHGFIDTFKTALEQPYQRLLQAAGPETAAAHWGEVCVGLQELNDYLVVHDSDSSDGPFFEGGEPGYAEAATAPALFRMAACLEGIRGLSLLATCDAMGLTRLAAWLKEILLRPTEVCDVAALPAHVYVTMARKLHVNYEGPPSAHVGTFSPRSSLDPGPRAVNTRAVTRGASGGSPASATPMIGPKLRRAASEAARAVGRPFQPRKAASDIAQLRL